MMRIALIFALIVVAATAFVAPANQALSKPAFSRVEAPKMIGVEGIEAVNSASTVVASTVSDFGGYLFPILGIGSLAALILFLAPPLADE
mmetsp:Transcript_9426/g.13556  ORF Transcript_9426/g.13556 Transcript_9426/m.13556 type:complete len:90 (+) Transcript_9426:80-349(+)|eukprot:CAMPEP_0202440960 /NCGR_PEP_ID=MMETSP1360-20130828/83_1 /ASSEMBLY_ACC=CAM_ASM_000848 /TAXON_ID=515479 /ORGANISM="Licmophora paradoxa, Strain CCMP2313" /LENGTH=89 /DNA_ID=CAMNT_0049055629 /DNA_START=48 /DNA_END=317 /DNA_ORIENTATION=+